MLKAITARVLAAQDAPDAIPLTLKEGDVVHVGDPHPQREGYVWIEDRQISAGWVPLDLLEIRGKLARVTAEYCSNELVVAPGDVVRIMWKDPAHGAWWCELNDGDRGWVRQELLAQNAGDEEP